MVKPFKIREEYTRDFRNGKDGLIYFFRDRAVKILTAPFDGKNLSEEYDIQKALYDKGYPVPKPYGVFPHDTRKWGIGREGLFMERIYGEDLSLSFSKRIKIIEGEDLSEIIEDERLFNEAKKIVEKIESEGDVRICSDYKLHDRNVMWDKRNKRIVLIDFGDWKFQGRGLK